MPGTVVTAEQVVGGVVLSTAQARVRVADEQAAHLYVRVVG
jgi:hypothetical protein